MCGAFFLEPQTAYGSAPPAAMAATSMAGWPKVPPALGGTAGSMASVDALQGLCQQGLFVGQQLASVPPTVGSTAAALAMVRPAADKAQALQVSAT